MAKQFVLVRIVNARGVNLNVFDFDFDLTWAGFFLNADQVVYGRFGGRDPDSAEKYLSLSGLRFAMQRALEKHQRRPPVRRPSPAVQAVEQYPAAARLTPQSCIHCHQVYDFRREEMRAAGTWRKEMAWVYPIPENLGFRIDPSQGDRVAEVKPESPASRAGLRRGDLLQLAHGMEVASFADVQYALHQAPVEGSLRLTWERAGKRMQASLTLPGGWRETDLSWRASSHRLGPSPAVHGEDLSAAEKKRLGLSEGQLAFRQGNFVTIVARQAGIRQNDIILGVDRRRLEMSVRQFETYVRLNYRAGDSVTYQVLRDGQRLDVTLKLPERSIW